MVTCGRLRSILIFGLGQATIEQGFYCSVMQEQEIKQRDSALWDKILALSIGPQDADLSFTGRLARENGWSIDYTEAVVFEYRRFLYLVAISDSALTPSDQVDQAWHLHLSYTKSYWQELCRSILGFELHHEPTAGGDAEQKRYRRQYANTLAFYREMFDETPPPAIWPSVDERFENPGVFVRIDTAKSWLLKKPTFSLATLALIVVSPLILVACSVNLGDTDIWFWLKVALGVYVVYKVAQWLGSSGGGRGGGGGGLGCGSGCGGCGGS